MTKSIRQIQEEARRLGAGTDMTKDAACFDPTCSYRAEAAFKRAAPALTAEEAKIALAFTTGDQHLYSLADGDRLRDKLSLIANGENDDWRLPDPHQPNGENDG